MNSKNYFAFLITLFIFSAHAMQKDKSETPVAYVQTQPSFSGIPKDVQGIILAFAKEGIVAETFQDTVKNISNFARTNKFFRDFLNQPQNIKWLIQSIMAKHHMRFLDEVAYGLKNMPGMKHPEIQQWIKNHELLKAANLGYLPTKKLLENGAQAAFIAENGRNALIEAIHTGDAELIRLLLDAGSDVNAANGTALMLAAKWNKLEVVKELLKANADLTLKNKDGHTAADIAEAMGNPEIAELIRKKHAEDLEKAAQAKEKK